MADRAAKDALYEGFAEVTKALASGRRAEIVDLLAQGERPVEQIAAEIGQSVANTSHHLRAMARAGLVTTRRDGTRIFYALASDRVAELWAALREVAADHVAGLHRLAEAYLGNQDGIEVIGREELAARLARGEVLVLDVRPAAEYAAGHIAGARSVPLAELRRRLRALPADAEMVAYCRGPYCVYADEAVRELTGHGLRARRLDDGYPEWRRAGLPIAAGEGEVSHGRDLLVDPEALRDQVRDKYREVAVDPPRRFHFHTGRGLAARLGYDDGAVDALPDRAVESFAGVGNPFSLRPLARGRTGRRCRLRRRVRLLHRRRPGRSRRPGGRRRHDRRDAGQGPPNRRGTRPWPRRVPRGTRRGAPGRGRLGRRGDLQRGDQPVRRQAGGVRRDPPGTAPRRDAAVRRHRQRPSRARSRRCATSTCGPVESPAGCPVRAGRRCSRTAGSPTW